MTTWLGFKDILRDIEQDKYMLYDITFRCNLSLKKKKTLRKTKIILMVTREEKVEGGDKIGEGD